MGHSLSSFPFFSLYTFLLVLPFQTFGSSRGLDGNSDAAGICAAAVAVRGYECHEFDVRN